MGANLAPSHTTDDTPEDDSCTPPEVKRARREPKSSETSRAQAYDFSPYKSSILSSEDCINLDPSSICWWTSARLAASRGHHNSDPPWERLPCVALVEVFRCLSQSDKFNASLSCRAWQLPFSRPALWRRGHFRFNGVDDWRALCFASMMGAALRHMTIDCSGVSNVKLKPSEVKSSAEKLAMFVTTLVRSGNRQISSFSLLHLTRLERHLATTDVLPPLTQFLAAQERLTSFDLGFASLTADQAFMVLGAVVEACGHSVQRLSILEVIKPSRDYDVTSDPRLLPLLAGFTVLSELHLSHRFLSDDLLYLLAGNLTGKLNKISVYSGPQLIGYQYSRTTSEAWRHIRHRCPCLQANYTLEDIFMSRCFKNMLVESIPLTRLDWRSHRLETLVNIRVCLDHINTHFGECLHHLKLHFHSAFLTDEEDVAAIVNQCPRLESLAIVTNPVPLSKRMRLERALRRAVARQPRSRLCDITINGRCVDLDESWTDTFVGWLVNQVE